MLQALAARPASEPVMTALRNAAVSVLRACEDGEFGFDAERFGCLQEMMESSPAVFGRSLEHGQKKQAEITRVIAERMGVDPATDMRPHVAAGLSNCAFRSAFEVMGCGVAKTDRFSDALDQVFGMMEDGLAYGQPQTS
jgi:hypothetical protein